VLFDEPKRDPKEGGVELRSAHISLLFHLGNWKTNIAQKINCIKSKTRGRIGLLHIALDRIYEGGKLWCLASLIGGGIVVE
jgi:hypothetical protein